MHCREMTQQAAEIQTRLIFIVIFLTALADAEGLGSNRSRDALG